MTEYAVNLFAKGVLLSGVYFFWLRNYYPIVNTLFKFLKSILDRCDRKYIPKPLGAADYFQVHFFYENRFSNLSLSYLEILKVKVNSP